MNVVRVYVTYGPVGCRTVVSRRPGRIDAAAACSALGDSAASARAAVRAALTVVEAAAREVDGTVICEILVNEDQIRWVRTEAAALPRGLLVIGLSL